MKAKKTLNSILDNNLVTLAISFFVALLIWVLVVVNVSPQTTRVIKDVRVTIDKTVPSQFGLEVFGETEFRVDVTVTGKKYQISSANLSADDIVVTAITNNVDSAGLRTVQLKAEPAEATASYAVSAISSKYIEVYFDRVKTKQFAIEPEIVSGGSDIVAKGYTNKGVNLSETIVTVIGPSTEVNKIEKAVASYTLQSPLTANLSAEADVVLMDDQGMSNFKYLTVDVNRVVMTVPVMRIKELNNVVTFKNVPEKYVSSPLSYTLSPATADFEVLVDEFEEITEFTVGTVDFTELTPGNNTFTFAATDTALLDDISEFKVTVNMTGISQKKFTVDSKSYVVNNPDKKSYKISDLNGKVTVVGEVAALKNVNEKSFSVEIDLSGVELSKGQKVEVPVVVDIRTDGCWVYGDYKVTVTI